MTTKCDVCRRRLVEPVGPLDAEILLAGEFPGWEEIKRGAPFVGRTGDVLKSELARVGIQYTSCRMTNLWQHEMTKDCDVNYHIKMLVAEMYKRKYILLMGSEVTKTFWNRGITEVCGLKMASKYIPADSLTVVTLNPASAFHGRIGEFRLSLEKFVSMIKEKQHATV